MDHLFIEKHAKDEIVDEELMHRRNPKAYVPLVETRHDEIQKHKFRSLFCFKPDNFFRQLMLFTVYNKWFDRLIFLSTLASFIVIVIGTNADMKYMAIDQNYQWQAELFFSIVFTLEFLMKVVAFGFIDSGRDSYLRKSGLNVFDLCTLVIGWLSLSSVFDDYYMLRSLRLLRILKSISLIKSIRTQLNAIVASFYGLLNVFLYVTPYTMYQTPCYTYYIICYMTYLTSLQQIQHNYSLIIYITIIISIILTSYIYLSCNIG